MMSRAALLIVALGLAGCGARAVRTTPTSAVQSMATSTVSATSTSAPRSMPAGADPRARPQAIEPAAGMQAVVVTPYAPVGDSAPVGDPNAHAPSLAEVRQQLRQEAVAATVSSATYINPLRYVSVWERTDQGVDAAMPVGAPILAPCRIKILAVEPNWYAGQPLVYWELLDGPDAGKVQYVAEQITDIATPGSILRQGQPIARYAASGTAIEFGWSTLDGITLARATTGYEEGEATPAGQSMRAWLNSLGANAGPG